MDITYLFHSNGIIDTTVHLTRDLTMKDRLYFETVSLPDLLHSFPPRDVPDFAIPAVKGSNLWNLFVVYQCPAYGGSHPRTSYRIRTVHFLRSYQKMERKRVLFHLTAQ